MINEDALKIVIKEMRTYRPDRSERFIRNMIDDWIKTQYIPLAETSQDIIWLYQRALKKLKR